MERMVLREMALEHGGHVVGGQRDPVVEPDPLPEAEAPDEPIFGDVPLKRQGGLDVAGPFAESNQGLKNLPGDERGHPLQ